jgi:biotin synthase
MAIDEQPFFPTAHSLLSTGTLQREMHERAFASARESFGPEVFVRAVVEVSNFCRQNCSYCGMRRENRALERFRAEPEALAELILEQRPHSVTDLNIQTGEDPVAVREVVLPLVRTLRRETSLGISVCLGSLRHDLYDQLKAVGASIYILKFETADPVWYEQLQAPGTLVERVQNIRYLSRTDWNVSSGFIAGLPGQTAEKVLQNIRFAAELPLDGCSVSPFIPGDETPLSNSTGAPIDLTLNSMAVLRLLKPDWVIPAVSALNLAQPGAGYRRGLRTGANLVTINMTPSDMRADYLLYKRDRFIMTEELILNAMAAEGLRPSKTGLAHYYASRKTQLAVA